jgi:hypothetical protein
MNIYIYIYIHTHTYIYIHTYNRYIDGIPRCEAWETVKRELGEKGRRIAMQGQTIAYNRSVVQLNECKFCLAAYAAALRSHTSTVLRGQLTTQVRGICGKTTSVMTIYRVVLEP